jgi:hypothetical protein
LRGLSVSESRFPVTAEQGQIASCQSSTDLAGQFERRGAIANLLRATTAAVFDEQVPRALPEPHANAHQ